MSTCNVANQQQAEEREEIGARPRNARIRSAFSNLQRTHHTDHQAHRAIVAVVPLLSARYHLQ